MQEQYKQIAQTLMREIADGQFQMDGTLPDRTALAYRFGVARATVNRAFKLLADRGVVQARRGSGTFLTPTRRRYRIALIGRESGLPGVNLPAGVVIRRFSFRELAAATAIESVAEQEGAIWYLPSRDHLDLFHVLQGRLPQIVVNRHLPDVDYVSTDHRGCIREITKERLPLAPDIPPVFLGGPAEDLPLCEREEGFVEACAEAGRFYRILRLPAGFESKIDALDRQFGGRPSGPALIVSGARANTGAVAAWARARHLFFRRHLWYSDFDNDFDADIWGVRVTSFLQDYERLLETAIAKLIEKIEGKADPIRVLVPPVRTNGET